MAFIISSMSRDELRDPEIEPPGGAQLLRSRALLGLTEAALPPDLTDRLTARLERLDEFARAWRLDRTRATTELHAAAAALQDPMARPWSQTWTQPRQPSVHECARCGYYPAARVRFTRYAAILISSGSRIDIQSLCRSCGMRRYYAAQTICILFGFLGVGLVATPFVMIRNARNKWRLRRIPRPAYRAAEVVTKRQRPASPALPLVLRICGWAMVLAVAGLVVAQL